MAEVRLRAQLDEIESEGGRSKDERVGEESESETQEWRSVWFREG